MSWRSRCRSGCGSSIRSCGCHSRSGVTPDDDYDEHKALLSRWRASARGETAVQGRNDKKMQSRFSRIVDEVEAELRGFDYSSPYFTLLRTNFVDDLTRIRELHRGGGMLEIGGYPFYFS